MLLRRHLGHLRAKPDGGTELDDAELADPAPAADQHFDARFALALTARAVNVLRADYRKRDRGALFEQLLATLGSPPEHGELHRIAGSLGIRANTLTVELARLRKRLREQLRAELEQLCADQETLESEWTILQRVLGGVD